MTLEEISKELASRKVEFAHLYEEGEKQKAELQEQKNKVASLASGAGLPIAFTLPPYPSS